MRDELCFCGRDYYDPEEYSSCYECYSDRRAAYVTCIACGVRWHDPNFALCFTCSHAGGRAGRRAREEAAVRLRVSVLDRDDYWCRWCLVAPATQVDHIKPCKVGGNARPWNLQALCADCNRVKSGVWWPGCQWNEVRREQMADYFYELRGLLDDDERAALKHDIEEWRRERYGTDAQPVLSLGPRYELEATA